MAFTANPITITRVRNIGTISALLVGRTFFENQIMVDDLDNVFFNQTEFGETVQLYHYNLKKWESYKDIFDDPHVSAQLGSAAEFNTIRPQFQIIKSKLLAPITKKDRVSRRGIERFIEDIVDDGTGVITVYMRRK